jgi:NAD(P)-dependent dehydrogenase (short-subunit alcohol dehydrogenase family)
MLDSERVALVTGGGSGIGRAVVHGFLERGYRVALTGRRRERLEETVALAPAGADRALVLPCDVRDPNAVAALFARLRDRFGRLDVLFNNAGQFAPPVPLEEVSFEQWREVLDTNLTGAFLCTQQAFALMKQQHPRGGRIINNGSIAAQAPRPHSAPYTASKHALTGLTKQTALDGRPYGIACGQIDIGNARTRPMPGGSEATMDPVHAANAVLYMASLPLEANILSLTVMATTMPFVGRG